MTARRQPHVMLIALGFPPSSGSGAYRGLAFANHLVAMGWDVTVLTVEEAFFDQVTRARDDSLLPLVDPRVRVVRVPMLMQHLVADVRAWGPVRGNFRQLHDDFWSLVQRRGFPERYAGWIPGLVRTGLAVHRKRPVDVVLGSGNPWSAFAAGYALRRLAGIPYVMDYRDSWTLDQFADTDAFGEGHPAWAWERRLIGSASRVWFVNDAMREWHARRYPAAADRMGVVLNGYDDEVVGAVGFRVPARDEPLRFGYVGTVTEVLPHQQTWAAWKRLRLLEDPPPRFDIYGRLGFFPRAAAGIIAMMPDPATSDVVFRGSVPKSGIGAVYDQLDVLVLMVPGSRYVTTGKVFENMATGKPMVLACAPDSDAVRVSAGHGLTFAPDTLDVDSLTAAMVSAARAAREGDRGRSDAARRFADRYRREHQVAHAEAQLREVAGRG